MAGWMTDGLLCHHHFFISLNTVRSQQSQQHQLTLSRVRTVRLSSSTDNCLSSKNKRWNQDVHPCTWNTKTLSDGPLEILWHRVRQSCNPAMSAALHVVWPLYGMLCVAVYAVVQPDQLFAQRGDQQQSHGVHVLRGRRPRARPTPLRLAVSPTWADAAQPTTHRARRARVRSVRRSAAGRPS